MFGFKKVAMPKPDEALPGRKVTIDAVGALQLRHLFARETFRSQSVQFHFPRTKTLEISISIYKFMGDRAPPWVLSSVSAHFSFSAWRSCARDVAKQCCAQGWDARSDCCRGPRLRNSCTRHG